MAITQAPGRERKAEGEAASSSGEAAVLPADIMVLPHTPPKITQTVATDRGLELAACPFCFTDHIKSAKVCPGCRATRRGSRWTSYREARRNDILMSGLALVAVLFLVAGTFYALASRNATTSTQTPPAPCEIANPTGPNC